MSSDVNCKGKLWTTDMKMTFIECCLDLSKKKYFIPTGERLGRIKSRRWKSDIYILQDGIS